MAMTRIRLLPSYPLPDSDGNGMRLTIGALSCNHAWIGVCRSVGKELISRAMAYSNPTLIRRLCARVRERAM